MVLMVRMELMGRDGVTPTIGVKARHGLRFIIDALQGDLGAEKMIKEIKIKQRARTVKMVSVRYSGGEDGTNGKDGVTS